ncbi:GNAT family acetyltransferase [Psychromonas sp. CNPT3]|uniref:GNAT family N-acetyltransferase n=1 Tax=Psychromonas sp. CNPT3 TaxID=314282 RepID=UPI00006E890A|nr:GNAT family N-acetyltransferase [Psychromonas sp. CNPT3]AGH82416.1 GNAT family acetyltransferase [Psychromonas sp. CNPT3]
MINLVVPAIELEKVKFPLLVKFYQRVYKKGRNLKGSRAFVLQRAGITCAAKLRDIDSHLLLCSVACDPAFRGLGDASRLVKYLLTRQTAPVYCFVTPTLHTFYQRLGFILSDAKQINIPLAIIKKHAAYQKNRPLLLMSYGVNSGKNCA